MLFPCILKKKLIALKLIDSFALLADESTDEFEREQLGLAVHYKIKGVPGFKETLPVLMPNQSPMSLRNL